MHGIGVDEAGRGCLAGPVVAAAVLFPENFDFAGQLPGLDDSKRLRQNERARLAALIPGLCLGYGLGLAWQEEIDAVNILNATFRAMSRAVLALAAGLEAPAPAANCLKTPAQTTDRIDLSEASAWRPAARRPAIILPRLLIDGNKRIPESQWLFCTQDPPPEHLVWARQFPSLLSRLPKPVPDLPGQSAIVGGDALLACISAASVLAKTTRDDIMTRLDASFPGYGLARHKGYGSKEHLDAIGRNGPCALHRKTFRGVRPQSDKAPARQLPLPDFYPDS